MFRTPTGYQARENEVRAGSVLTPPQKRIFWSYKLTQQTPAPAVYRSGQVRSGQVRSGQVRSGQVRSGQVRTGQVRSGQARSGQVRSGQVRSGQVRSGQAKECGFDPTAAFPFDGLDTSASWSSPLQAFPWSSPLHQTTSHDSSVP